MTSNNNSIKKTFIAFIVLTSILLTSTVVAQKNDTDTESAVQTKISAPKELPPTGINLALSPIFINLATRPGEPVSSQMKVTNNNNYTEYFKISVSKYTASPTGEGAILADMTSKDTFKDWISFSDSEFIVGSRETKLIKFTISPPKSAALGYYYAIIIDRIQKVKAKEKTTVVSAAPALSVLLEVESPNAKRELQLVDFKTDKMIYEYLPVNFSVKVKNTGNIHIVPAGDIFIDSSSSKDIGIIPANSGRGNVLPQTERTYLSSWDSGFLVRAPKIENEKEVLDKKGKPVYELKIDWSKANQLRFGKYNAHMVMVYDNGQRDVPVEASLSFWVIPWKIIGVILLIALFAFLGIKNTLSQVFRGVSRNKK